MVTGCIVAPFQVVCAFGAPEGVEDGLRCPVERAGDCVAASSVAGGCQR